MNIFPWLYFNQEFIIRTVSMVTYEISPDWIFSERFGLLSLFDLMQPRLATRLTIVIIDI